MLLGILIGSSSCGLENEYKPMVPNPLELPSPRGLDSAEIKSPKATVRIIKDSIFVEDKPVPMREVENHLKALSLHRELDKASKFVVLLQLEKETKMEQIVRLMEIGQRNNFSMILSTAED